MNGSRLFKLAALAFVGALAGFLIYTHLAIGLSLTNTPVALQFPPLVNVQAQAQRPVKILLDGDISAQVPVAQDLTVPLKGNYLADAKAHAKVPLKMTITYQGTIPVRGFADIEGNTSLIPIFNHKLIPKLPIKIKLPLDFDVPVSLVVPVNTVLDLVYDGPLGIGFNQDVHTRLDTTLVTKFHVNREVNAPIMSPFGLRLHSPKDPVHVLLDSRLGIPLAGIGLHLGQHAPESASAPVAK